jgi:DNA repair exonuclease SbcCD ATPase subunit
MFSFGVLVTQLVTGEFPRIDRREQQVAQAMTAMPRIGPLISRCLQLHPERRPTASMALEELKAMKRLTTDQNHGVGSSKSTIPHHNYGPLAERWLRSELIESNRKLESDLATTEARLSSELGRWRVEADARDSAESQVGNLTKQLEKSKAALEDARKLSQKCREESEEQQSLRKKAEEDMATMKQEMVVLRSQLKDSETNMRKEMDAAAAARIACEYAEIAKKRAIESEKRADATCAAAVMELEKVKQELERTQTEKMELNEWLQQSINRWEVCTPPPHTYIFHHSQSWLSSSSSSFFFLFFFSKYEYI